MALPLPNGACSESGRSSITTKNDSGARCVSRRRLILFHESPAALLTLVLLSLNARGNSPRPGAPWQLTRAKNRIGCDKLRAPSDSGASPRVRILGRQESRLRSALNCTQSHSIALNRTQLHSVALSCTQLHSVALNRTQSHSIALNRTQSHSIALNRTQSHSIALNRTQLHSIALSCTQLHSIALNRTQSHSIALKSRSVALTGEVTTRPRAPLLRFDPTLALETFQKVVDFHSFVPERGDPSLFEQTVQFRALPSQISSNIQQ